VSLVGPTGLTGQTGATGPAGANGLDGKSVLNGTSNPTASLGANGDFYINTATNTLFGPKSIGGWGSGVSLVGLQGPPGLLSAGSSNGNTPYWNGINWVVNSSMLYNNGSQVAVNTTSPNSSAILEISSTTKGVLFPRMTKLQRQAIPTPPAGLLVFQTDAPLGFYYFDGTYWVYLSGSSSPVTDPNSLIYTVSGF
jgi:hypothetical protein